MFLSDSKMFQGVSCGFQVRFKRSLCAAKEISLCFVGFQSRFKASQWYTAICRKFQEIPGAIADV